MFIAIKLGQINKCSFFVSHRYVVIVITIHVSYRIEIKILDNHPSLANSNCRLKALNILCPAKEAWFWKVNKTSKVVVFLSC